MKTLCYNRNMNGLSFVEIKRFSEDLGIDDIKITDATPITEHEDWIQERAHRGHRTEFEPEEGLTGDPSSVLPGAKHVLVFGMRLPRIRRERNDRALAWADIAVGEDYHRRMRRPLERIAERIALHGNVYVQVDTGRLRERAFAHKAGMGSIGKHTFLIHPEFGTWITLGLIVTDAPIRDLPEVTVNRDRCGDCTRCIEACPCHAILPYRVAAGRCLSYLTQKSTLSQQEAARIASAYGCDICQRVCPLNLDVPKTETDAPTGIRIEDLLLSKREFRRRYGHSAAFWRGPSILKRNVLLHLGNERRTEYDAIIRHFEQSESNVLRNAARYARDRREDNRW